MKEKMQDNPFPAAERILADIEAVFKKDPKLAEFDVVPVNENQNKSPVLHASHSLGLESWCVRHVYCYVCQRLMDLRKRRGREDSGALIRLLRGVLLLNPDVGSFWHMRKDLVLSSQLDPFVDLHFSAVVLSYKPKCSEAFSHRRWLISQLLGIQSYISRTREASLLLNNTYSAADILESELKVSGLAANRYANNYHAWNHRIWAIQNISSPCSKCKVLLSEWHYTGQWIASHVSDHSGMQYRQFVLEQMIVFCANEGMPIESNASLCSGKQIFVEALVQVLMNFGENFGEGIAVVECGADGLMQETLLRLAVLEMLYNADLICQFVGHEALWCHRRFMLHTLMKLVKNWVSVECGTDLADQLLKAAQTQEQLLVNHCTLEKHSDIHQVRFAKRHALWMERMLHISIDCGTSTLPQVS